MILNVLDLFSGIGGFSLGLESTGYFRTVAFCEIDERCQNVLKKHWSSVPIIPDIKDIKRGIISEKIDILAAGFPCQPYSIAGKRKGVKDERNMLPELMRVIRDIRPSWCIFENVTGFIRMGYEQIASELESHGYTVTALIIPAHSVGLPHRRDRLWIVAHNDPNASGNTKRGDAHERYHMEERSATEAILDDSKGLWDRSPEVHERDAAHSDSKRGERDAEIKVQRLPDLSCWEDVRSFEDFFRVPSIPEPLICRDGYGLSDRVDILKRLKMIGNSLVPQIVAEIGHAIAQAERDARRRL